MPSSLLDRTLLEQIAEAAQATFSRSVGSCSMSEGSVHEVQGSRMSEAELIERAGAGDPRAIRELHDRHAPLVLTVVRRITGDEDAARDCAQEVWIRALRSLHTFEGRAPFSAWIRRIAARAAFQFGRSERRRTRREAVFSVSAETFEEPRRPRTCAEWLEEAVLGLPQGMRRVLVLHDVEGFTHEEIGELLHISPGTSKSQLFKARAKVRETIRAAEGDRESDMRSEERVMRQSGSWSEGTIERGGVAGWST